jgi:hypothetical protein
MQDAAVDSATQALSQHDVEKDVRSFLFLPSSTRLHLARRADCRFLLADRGLYQAGFRQAVRPDVARGCWQYVHAFALPSACPLPFPS